MRASFRSLNGHCRKRTALLMAVLTKTPLNPLLTSVQFQLWPPFSASGPGRPGGGECPLEGAVPRNFQRLLHTNVILKKKNGSKPRNTGCIPKKNVNQVLGRCNEVWMAKIGQDRNGLRQG